MKKFLSNITKHPIVSSIVATALTSTPVVALVKSINLKQAFFVIMGWIKAFFLFGIPVWVILLVVVILILFIWIIGAGSEKESKGVSLTRIQDYKTDLIEGIRWHWKWHQGYDRRLTVGPEDLIPICPQCQNDLITTDKMHGYMSFSAMGYYCDHCQFTQRFSTGSHSSFLEKVVREIVRRTRTGEWKNSSIQAEK